MSIKLNYWIRKSQKRASGQYPIYLNISYEGINCQTSIGISIRYAQWDKKAQRIKGTSEEVDALNGKLSATKSRALKLYNELLLSGVPFNAFSIKDKLHNGITKAVTFNDLMNEYIDKMTSLKGRGYSQPTIIKYRNSQKRVNEFVRKHYKRKQIYLYELDYAFIDRFATFLRIEFDNGNTTIYKHYQRISRVVRVGVNMGYLDKYPFGEFRIKQDKAPLVYLTYEEVIQIQNKSFDNIRLETVRLLFLLSCYSGLSFKEMENLQPRNLVESNGSNWLSMIRQKTKRTYRVVLLPQAVELINQIIEMHPPLKNGRLLPMISNQKYNTYLKELADLCGINKRLTSHVGRKTFSIGIALRSKVSIELLSALLGHSSIRVTTDYYAKVTDEIMLSGVSDLSNALTKMATPFPKSKCLIKSKKLFEIAPKQLLLLYLVGISYSFIIFLVVLPVFVLMYNK